MSRAAVALLLVLAGCSRRPTDAPSETPDALESRRQVWEAIQPAAAMRGIDPLFAYAMVAMESDFDAHARRGEARGLLQIKPRAWRNVSKLPYETNVWDWRTNLAVGMDGLAATKATLGAKGAFSYPLLWAAHRYGLDYVAARGFDMSRIPRPPGRIAARMWSGDIHPLTPPK